MEGVNQIIVEEETMEKIIEISLNDIQPHAGNRRVGGFDQEKLDRLADSIRTVGVQQPAVVRLTDHDGKYELVAGQRRWMAAGIAGLDTLPCVVRDLDDLEVLKIQMIENLQREDIHPLDEADGYRRLREKAGYDAEFIALEIGRSISYIYQRLRLLELVPKARKEFVSGNIVTGHAILLARLQPKQQDEALEYCRRWKGGTSVRDLDQWIRSNILMELKEAAFKKDDPDLVPDAGTCVECPKRTGFEPALFPDIKERDVCTDPACFNNKLDVLVERRRNELVDSETTFLMVSDVWVCYNEEQGLKKRIPGIYLKENWEECKKKDEGSIRCLIAAGPGRGRVTWGRKRTSSAGLEKSPEEKKKAREEKKELRLLQDARRETWRRTFTEMKNDDLHLDPTESITEAIMRRMACVFYGRIWNNHQQALCELEGWERPPKENYKNTWDRPGWEVVGEGHIKTMEASDLIVFLIKCAFIGDVEIDEYNKGKKRELLDLARDQGVDEKAIIKEMRAAKKKGGGK